MSNLDNQNDGIVYNSKRLNFNTVFASSWKLITTNLGFFLSYLGLQIALGVVSIISFIVIVVAIIGSFGIAVGTSFNPESLKPDDALRIGVVGLGSILAIILFISIISISLGLNFFNLCYKLIKKEDVAVSSLLKIRWMQGLSVIGLYILFGLILIIPFALLILPGAVLSIFLLIRFGYYQFFLANDKDIGVFDALEKSWNLTKNRFWEILGYSLVPVGISFLAQVVYQILINVSSILTLLLLPLIALLFIWLEVIWVYIFTFLATPEIFDSKIEVETLEESEKKEPEAKVEAKSKTKSEVKKEDKVVDVETK